jgi:hypothetical protein
MVFLLLPASPYSLSFSITWLPYLLFIQKVFTFFGFINMCDRLRQDAATEPPTPAKQLALIAAKHHTPQKLQHTDSVPKQEAKLVLLLYACNKSLLCV